MEIPEKLLRSTWCTIAKRCALMRSHWPTTGEGRSINVVDVVELESRILLSSSPATIISEPFPDAGLAEIQLVQLATEQSQAPDVRTADFSGLQDASALQESLTLVFIDAGVKDNEALVADLLDSQADGRQLRIVHLEANRDGIDQISDALSQFQNVDAVHVVSHGGAGLLRLGSSWLTADSLRGYAGQLSGWADSLSSDADILFYGCNLAGSSAGQELIVSIGALTGADVAASTDTTGQTILGGDWEFEFTAGSVETEVVFSQYVQQHWSQLLNVTVDATSTGTAAASATSQVISHSTSGSDRLMLVGISFGRDQGDSVTSVTYNGVALTKIGAQDNVDLSKSRVEIWALVAPVTGTHDVVITFSGTNHEGVATGVTTLNGVDQTTPLGSFVSAEGDSSIPTLAVPSTYNELVFGVVAVDDNNDLNLRPNGGQTELWDLFQDRANGASSLEVGAPSVVTSWTLPSTNKWVVGAVSIKPTAELVSTGEFLVNTSTTNVQETSQVNRGSHRAVATAANGDYVVVWSDFGQDGDGWGVYGQLYDKNGLARGGELRLSQTTANDQFHATVGMDASGRFVVAWMNEDASGGFDIYARRFNADGTPAANEFRVNDVSAQDRISPSIDVASDGTFVVAWQGLDGLDAGDIFARRFTAAGVALDLSDIAVELAAGGDYDPAVAINDNGQFAIIWDDAGGVKLQRFNSNGSMNGAQITVDTSIDAGDGSLALHNDGSLVVVWREGVADRDVLLRRYTNTAVALATEVVATSSANDQTNPSIAMDNDGNFIVVWEGNGNQSGNVDTLGIFGQKYASTGAKVGGEFLINESLTGTQHSASVAMLDLNNFVAVWSGNGDRTNEADTAGVFARQFGTTPVVTTSLIAAADTYIDQGSTGNNYGASTSLIINQGGGGIGDQRALLQFDFSSLPTGAIITGATLSLFARQNDGAFDINIYEVSQAWSEGGGDNTAGAASWNERLSGTTWTSAGGDYDPTIIDTLNTTSLGQHSWNLMTLVKAWVEDNRVNNGIIIGSPDGGSDTVVYDSRQGSIPPQLIISYVVSNVAPTDIGPNSFSINENVNTTSGVSVGTLTATDPDVGETFTYTIVGGADEATFSVGGVGGNQLILTDGVLDFESKSSYSVTVRVADSASNTYDETLTVSVVNLNDDPTNAGSFPVSDLAAAEETPTNVDLSSILLADQDAGTGQLTLKLQTSGGGQITAVAGTGITIGGSTINRTLTGTLADLNAYLGNPTKIQFTGAVDIVGNDADSITVAVNDNGNTGPGGASDIVLGTINVDLSPVNDPPIQTVPGPQTVAVGMPYTFNAANGNLISINDVDAGSSLLIVTLIATNGRVTLASTTGLIFTFGNGTANSFMTFTGTLNQINAALDGLRFTGSSVGAGSLQIISNDFGNTGSGGPKGDSDTIAITVNAANFILDQFNVTGYNGNDGNVNWTNSWQEIGESNGASGGQVRVTTLLGEKGLQIQQSGKGAMRQADLSSAATATLSFDYARLGLDTSTDFIVLEVSGDGGVTWTELDRYQGPADDSGLIPVSYDISGFIASNTQIRFVSSGMSSSESLFVDNVQIEFGVGSPVGAVSDADGSVNQVDENAATGSTVGITAVASDPDTNHTVTYGLLNDAGGRFAIDGTTGVVTVANGSLLNYESATNHTIRVLATSSDASSTAQDFSIAIGDINDAPVVANTIPNQSATQNVPFSFQFAANTFADEDGNALTYTVSPLPTWLSFNATTRTFSGTPADADVGTVNVRITASDGNSGSIFTDFLLTVVDVNDRPTVSLTPIVTNLNENASTTSAIAVATINISDDALGTETITLSGADAGLFEVVGNQLRLRAGSVLDFETNPSLDVTVNVDDASIPGSPDDFATYTVTIGDVNERPSVTLTPIVTNLNENASTSSAIAVATINISDDALGTETITLSGADAGLFEVVGNQLRLRAGSMLDFETNPSLDVTVNVDDASIPGSPDDSAIYTVTIGDVNERPSVSLTPIVTNLNENASTTSAIAVATINISDDALGTETITLSGADAGFFEVVGNQLRLKAGSVLDFETNPSLDVTVNVDDASLPGSPDDFATYTVTIIDVNDAPTGITPNSVSILDGTDTTGGFRLTALTATDPDAGDTFTYAIMTGADGSRFLIGGANGNDLMFDDGIVDRATKNSYSVLIQVADASGATHVETVTVIVTPFNRPPTAVTPNTFAVDENVVTTAGYSVGVLSATDPDASETFSYSIETGFDGAKFSIGGVGNDELILTDGRLDFENQSSYTVVVRVTDSALNTFDQTITVTVNDLNEAPRVQLQNVVSSIAENALTETSLKLADIAMEDDAAGVNILSLSGRNAGDFEIVGGTELHLRAGTALDYENQTSLEVNITVHDMTLGLATQDTVSFTLLLADVDEPPQAADDTYSASSNTVVIVAPGVLANDVDPEGAPLALTVLTPPSHGVLTVGPDGSFTYVPDAGFFGTDSFVYHLNDGSTVSNPATVKLLIQVPLANPSLTSTIETDKNNENGRQDTNDSNDQTPLIPMTGVDIESVSKAETQIDRPLTGDIAEEDDQSRVTVLTVQAETPDSGPAVRPLVQLLTRTNDIVRSVATATVPPSVVASSYNFNVAHAFVDVLNELRDEVAVDNLLKQTVIGSSMVVSTSLSIGYVIWLIRGGVLLSSVLSSLPAWQVMDPLPVLGFIDDEDEENMEDDSLESLVAKSNSDRQETEQQ